MEKYITAAEYAEQIGVGVERVRQLCKESRIAGATKMTVGSVSVWLIPSGTGDVRLGIGRPRLSNKQEESR